MRQSLIGTTTIRSALRSMFGWIIAAPAQQRPSGVRIWSSRVISALCVAWLFAFGPAGLLAPKLFGFSAVSSRGINVYYQNQVPQAIVDDVLASALNARSRNLAFWSEPVGGVKPINIYLCNSRLRWQELTLWSAGGNACAAASNIFLSPLSMPNRSNNLADVIAHEMSHVFLVQHFGYLHSATIPNWINEGLATHVGQNFWASDDWIRTTLEKSPSPRLITATDLSSRLGWFNAFADTTSAPLAYGHARSLCTYLVERFGIDRIKSYLASTSWRIDTDSTFRASFGMDMATLDQVWLNNAKSHGWMPQNTALVQGRPGAAVLAWFMLPYVIICVGLLWIIRQLFWVGRFVRSRFVR